MLAVGPGKTCLYWNLKAEVDIKPLGPVFSCLLMSLSSVHPGPFAPQGPVQLQQANTFLGKGNGSHDLQMLQNATWLGFVGAKCMLHFYPGGGHVPKALLGPTAL